MPSDSSCSQIASILPTKVIPVTNFQALPDSSSISPEDTPSSCPLLKEHTMVGVPVILKCLPQSQKTLDDTVI
jgi:hypothetical protein